MVSKKKIMSEIQVFRPFGPSIAKIKLPPEIIEEMNSYVDEVINDKKKIAKLDHGTELAGKVKQEFLLEEEFMKKIKWAEFLAQSINKWIQADSNKKLKHFQMIKSWIVRQFKNEYNPMHIHSGHVSGVGYLKVPKNMGEAVVGKNTNENGKLVLMHGSVNSFSKASLIIKPEVGDFYLFPNYLLHAVYPFKDTDEERRSVSFNANLDKEAISYTN